ncbi:MAG: transposase [Gaiellaceae bacterium]
MPRRPREERSGGFFHVTSRGTERRLIFIDGIDRRSFLDLLEIACMRCNWRCLAWCLMENHYHLIVQTLEPTLSDGMRRLNGHYGQRFNRRHDRSGHLFQGRFYASAIELDSYLREAIRYTLLNPVRAGLVGSPSAWPWSSYRATVERTRVGGFFARELLLELFGEAEAVAISHFERFVLDGLTGD